MEKMIEATLTRVWGEEGLSTINQLAQFLFQTHVVFHIAVEYWGIIHFIQKI